MRGQGGLVRAGVAASAYAAATRHNPHEQLAIECHLAGTGTPDGHESSVEVVSDLLRDLHHLADRPGLDWDRLLPALRRCQAGSDA